MISNNQAKLITSLKQKKQRHILGVFVAEGPKVISEFIEEGMLLQQLYTTESALFHQLNREIISETELKKISFLKTPNKALALFKIPKTPPLQEKGLLVALDAIRDPGNLGTIIRLCDWYGIRDLICSSDCVDAYNPKVVQASMGSLARVHIHYLDLETFFAHSSLPVYGGFMDGRSIYEAPLLENAVILMGNEANGISQALEKHITDRIAIPRFGSIQKTESLNVAIATAILLNEFRRPTGR